MHIHTCIYAYIHMHVTLMKKGYQLESGGVMRRVQGRVAGRGWREERGRK